LISVIPTGPFVSISTLVANRTLIGTILTPSEPLGVTTTFVIVSEESVTRIVTPFWTFSKPSAKTSSIKMENVKVITPVSLAWGRSWSLDWTIKTLPMGGLSKGLLSPGVPSSLLPGLAVSKRRTKLPGANPPVAVTSKPKSRHCMEAYWPASRDSPSSSSLKVMPKGSHGFVGALLGLSLGEPFGLALGPAVGPSVGAPTGASVRV
jgi:hypothetical protein